MTAAMKRRLEMSLARLGEPKVWLGVGEELGLSPRELQIAILLVRGLSQTRIAQTLGIERGTVDTYVRRIYRKVGVHTRARLLVTVVMATGCMLKT